MSFDWLACENWPWLAMSGETVFTQACTPQTFMHPPLTAFFHELLGFTNNWQFRSSVYSSTALQTPKKNNKMLNSSGLNVGVDFKHLKAGSSKTLNGIPVPTELTMNRRPTHKNTHLLAESRAIFTRALTLYLWELKGGQRRIFLYLPAQKCEERETTILLFSVSHVRRQGWLAY